MKHFSAVVVLFTCFAAAAPAAAQTMQFTDKGYVTVNLAGQVGSHTLDTNFNFPLFDETATVNSSQKVSGGFLFDIGGAYRVWGNNLLAGVSYSHTSSDADVAISGSIPDPVFFDRPTTFERTQGGAKHSENAVHISAIWMIPVANKTDVAVFAGPSIFFVKQQTIGTPTVSPGPVVDTPFNEVKKTSGGFHIGADLQYMVAKQWGVGGLMRYTWASASITDATEKLTVGGFQIGAGARVRF